MNLSPGNQALMLKAEALMLQALILLDEAEANLPAVHLQSALDLLEDRLSELSHPPYQSATTPGG